MVAHVADVSAYVVEYYASVFVDDRNAKVAYGVACEVVVQPCGVIFPTAHQRLMHLVVVVLQPQVERFHLILFLAILLKHDECHGEEQK